MYTLAHVTKLYQKGRRAVPAVRDLSLVIDDGEWLAVQGRTGHGKSTLLNLLGGLDLPTEGSIQLDSQDLAQLREAQLGRLRAQSIGFIFQTFNLVQTLSAADNVEAALIPLGFGATERRRGVAAELRAIIIAQQAWAPAGEPAVTRAAAPRACQGTAEPAGQDTLTYAGNVPADSGRMVISQHRTLDDVLTSDPSPASRVFAALASPARITLLKTLLDGPRSTQQLRGVLDDPSVGQLYHHLKELLATGLVIQPGRSNYALRRGTQIELCILIAAATSLATAPGPGAAPRFRGATRPRPRQRCPTSSSRQLTQPCAH